MLVSTDEGSAKPLPEHHLLPGREAGPATARSAPGLTVPGKIDKMGYKGVDTTEMVFDGYRTAREQILGGKAAPGSRR